MHSGSDQPNITVIVPSWQAMPWYKRCLSSLITQRLEIPWQVLLIDDHSTDGTWDYARTVASVQPHWRAMRTSEHNGAALPTIVEAMQHVAEDTIVAIVDGDDWLYDTSALKTVWMTYMRSHSQEYQPPVWMTYGQYVCNVRGQVIENVLRSAPTPPALLQNTRGIREFTGSHGALPYGHLRTFLAKLYRSIPPDYLLDPKGRIWGAGGDVPMMVSMAELAREHAAFIKEPLYAYNMDNPRRDNSRYPGVQHETWQIFDREYPALTGLYICP